MTEPNVSGPINQASATYSSYGQTEQSQFGQNDGAELRQFQFLVEHASEQIALLTQDCRFRYANQAFCLRHGYSRVELQLLYAYDLNVNGNLEEYGQLWQAAQQQESIQLDVQHRSRSGEVFALEVTLKYFQYDGEAFLCGFAREITDRQRRERNQALLVEIADDLSRLVTPDEIMQAVGVRLGTYLNLSTCVFADVDDKGEDVTGRHAWNKEGVPSLKRTFRLADYLSEEFLQAIRAGETIFVCDTATDQRTEAYASLQVRAFLDVPFHRNGRWQACLGVTDTTPRNWRKDEIELVRDVAERIFPRIERARAETALRKSEEKYRTLFDSVNEGYCLIEMIYDELGRPVDWLYLEANPTFEQQSGFVATGKTASELAGKVEAFWFELYERVLKTGEPERAEKRVGTLDRWYRIFASRVGGAGSCRLAVMFDDITQRKQADKISRSAAELDAFRVVLSDALRSLIDPVEIQITAARILGETLGVTRVIYLEVVSDGEDVIIHCNYTKSVTQLSGRYRLEDYRRNLSADHQSGRTQVINNIPNSPGYTDAEKARYEAIQIAAHIDVPIIKDNQFVALLAVHYSAPRQWTETEIKLVEETAERTWEAVERAHAEAALQEAHIQLESALAAGGIYTWRWNIPENRMIVDVGCANLFGVDPARATAEGLPPEVFIASIHPDDQADVLAALEQAVSMGEVYQAEYRVYNAAGEVRWVVARGQVEQDVDGRPIALPGALADVTAAKHLEAGRKWAEEERDRFFQLSHDMMAIIHMDGYFLQVNPAWTRTLGYILQELIGQPYIEFIHPDDRARTIAEAEIVAQGHSTLEFENRYRTQDGSYRWMSWNVVPSPEQQLLYCVARDITDRKQAEQALAADLNDTQRLSELSTRLIGEDDIQVLFNEIIATAVTIMQADAGTIQLLDPQTQDLLLLSTQGIEPTLSNHFQRVQAGSETSCRVALTNGTRTLVDFDAPGLPDPHGSLKLHLDAGLRTAQSTPLVTRSGRAIGMLSIHWCDHYRPSERQLRLLDLLTRQAADLIERRQTEVALQAATAEAQQRAQEAEAANRIKDEFLAVLSHELRSPLNPILGWSTLLQTQRFGPTQTTQALQTIERNARVQMQLVEDLLDVAKILRGKLSLTTQPLDPAWVIRDALETVRTAATAKAITLHPTLNSVGQVMSDAARLQQIVWNLLSNAVKFTPHGGQVEIRLQRVAAQAEITVSDTGKGIKPEFLPYIFEHFRQEDSSTTRQFGGLGLGLAIVRSLVEAHGGTITAQSSGEGQGATFTVRLPLIATESPVMVADATVEQAPDLTGVRVLCVDDEPDARELLTTILRLYGADVLTVTTAAEVLAELECFCPQVLVSDIGMPEVNGYALIQQVRALPAEQGGQVPAIALTAYAREEDAQKAQAAGFGRHMSKPVDPQALAAAVDALMQAMNRDP